MTALQVIIKEAKAIRTKSPKIEWKKAVAQASAIYANKHKGKSPVGKKKVVKKSAKKVAKKAIKKHTHWKTIHAHERRVNGVKKPTEKAVLKSIKHAASVQKAHMSSIGSHTIDRLKDQMSLLNKYQSFHDHYFKMPIKERPKLEIKKLKSLIKETKTHITQLKKHI